MGRAGGNASVYLSVRYNTIYSWQGEGGTMQCAERRARLSGSTELHLFLNATSLFLLLFARVGLYSFSNPVVASQSPMNSVL